MCPLIFNPEKKLKYQRDIATQQKILLKANSMILKTTENNCILWKTINYKQVILKPQSLTNKWNIDY